MTDAGCACTEDGKQGVLPLRSNADVKKLFALKRPCADCPFRTDRPGYLTARRIEMILKDLDDGTPFCCHKTTTVPGIHVTDRRARYCAGYHLFALAQDRLPQTAVLAVALGLWSPTELDSSVPVAASPAELLAHHEMGA